MKSRNCFVFAGLMVCGCASVPVATLDFSDAPAVEMLNRCAQATDGAAMQKLSAVDVQFDGRFANDIVGRVQPALVDARFRGGASWERYALDTPEETQTDVGPGGVKFVDRGRGRVRVWYNGVESPDPTVDAAAALVADGYRMFLLGPKFFAERDAVVEFLGTDSVDGFDCDNLLATLRPGIGVSAEDRVIVSIDRQTHLIRRLRMTVEGLETTRGAVADIFPRDYIRIDGVQWPTKFYEELKSPFEVAVHRWRVTELKPR